MWNEHVSTTVHGDAHILAQAKHKSKCGQRWVVPADIGEDEGGCGNCCSLPRVTCMEAAICGVRRAALPLLA